MDKNAKVFVAGHRGMVGSAIVRRLQAAGYTRVITRSHSELDLLDQRAVHDWLQANKPDYLFIAAAKVGGIQANNVYRAEFLYQNLMIEANLIHGAHVAGLSGCPAAFPVGCNRLVATEAAVPDDAASLAIIK